MSRKEFRFVPNYQLALTDDFVAKSREDASTLLKKWFDEFEIELEIDKKYIKEFNDAITEITMSEVDDILDWEETNTKAIHERMKALLPPSVEAFFDHCKYCDKKIYKLHMTGEAFSVLKVYEYAREPDVDKTFFVTKVAEAFLNRDRYALELI